MEQLTEVAEIQISYIPTKNIKPIVTTSFQAPVELLPLYPGELIALQEQFVVMYLNRANGVLGIYKLSTGGITGTVADTRLILGFALKCAACGIILSHNHPSGCLQPSSADIKVSEQIVAAAKLMDIKVADISLSVLSINTLAFRKKGSYEF